MERGSVGSTAVSKISSSAFVSRDCAQMSSIEFMSSADGDEGNDVKTSFKSLLLPFDEVVDPGEL